MSRELPNSISPFTPADLPISVEGRIYHLNLQPDELANSIIIVGDPERVPLIASEFLTDITTDVFHRGLRSITGTVKLTKQRVSIITSGMGTPSLEIVLQELAALNEIDFNSRTRKKYFEPLRIIRVGTSGGLRDSTELGSLIVSAYAVGMDNTGLFYDTPPPDAFAEELEQRVSEAISPFIGEKRVISPYAAKADPQTVLALEKAALSLGATVKIGITISSSGFFANQGRAVARIPLRIQEVDKLFADLESPNPELCFENMEMESSFLFHFAGALGYKAGAICPAIANRRNNTFAKNHEAGVRTAANAALIALNT